MNAKEAQEKIITMLAGGSKKDDVFNQLIGQGVSDRKIAYMIASYADPALCKANKGLINGVLAVAWVQFGLGALIGLSMGLTRGLASGLFIASFISIFTLAFVWGFLKNKAWAYNATILLSIIQLSRQLSGYVESPIETSIFLAISVAWIAYVWYVRDKLFPDFTFTSPRKVNGKYVFISS